MRKWLAAWAARRWVYVRAFGRAGLAALALSTAALVVAAPADIARGLEWLQAHVQSDGSLLGQPNDGAHQLARCETAATLMKLVGDDSKVALLLAGLQSPDSATQTLACWQELQQRLGQTILVSDLDARRISQQGYAPFEGFAVASALDTGWALAAHLQNLSSTDAQNVIAWLQTNQRTDGSFATAGTPDLLATTSILRSLHQASSSNANAATVASRAASFLLGKVDQQGAWLGDTAVTALVFESVHPYSAALPTLAAQVESYLLGKQSSDGSWSGDPYITAVVLRALALVPVAPLNPTQAGLKIKFIDARSGTPVPGVALQGSGPANISAVSDAAGNAQVFGAVAGAYQLQASTAGFASVSFSITLAAGKTLDLGSVQLTAPINNGAAVISGSVREQGSQLPIAGATISLQGQSVGATSAADGTYLIANVTPGAVTVRASRAGYDDAAGNLTAQGGQVAYFSPSLVASTSSGVDCKIVGTLVAGATQLPVAGVVVAVTGANNASATTDSAGRFTISGLLSGLVNVSANKAGYEAVIATTALNCSTLRTTSIDFSPKLYLSGSTPAGANTAGLTAVVMNAVTNEPVTGATVIGTPDSGAARSAVTGADGRFTLEGFDGPAVQLSVQAQGLQSISLQYALEPLQTVDLGQIRLRPPKVEQLLPDLQVLSVKRAGARTEPQTLRLTGSVEIELVNSGTQPLASGVAIIAFSDTDRDGAYRAAVDILLGQLALPQTLQAGQTVTLQIQVGGVLPFRDSPIHVSADPENTIAEVAKTNNVRSTAQESVYVPNRQQFAPVIKWQWTNGNVMMPPVVAPLHDTNGDGKVDARDTARVIFVSYGAGQYYLSPGVLRVLDGATGVELFNVPAATLGACTQCGLAVADLDNDGKPEIIGARTSGGPFVLRNNGSLWWQGSGTTTNPSVADIDGDGKPEILFGNQIYFNTGGVKKTLAISPAYLQSTALDFRGDASSLNIAVGSTIFTSDGVPVGPVRSGTSGFHAVGRFGVEADPQLVAVDGGKLYFVDKTSTVLGSQTLPGGGAGGAPVVADMDGDGIPEVGVAGSTRYTAFRGDGSVLWSVPIVDPSANTGSTVFDFDGDGRAEVIYRDTSTLRVFDGATGVTLFQATVSSATGMEYPLVADVDNDGHADLVVPADTSFGGSQRGIYVYRDVNNAWVPARNIWNQFAYHVDNINDDLSVPAKPTPSWKTHNTFRLNKRVDGDPRAVADLTVGYLRVADGGPAGSTITVRAGNSGSYRVPAGTLLAVYSTNPALGTPTASALVGTAMLSADMQSGEWRDVAIAIPQTLSALNSMGSVWIVGDDDGTGKHAITDFDRTNNTLAGDLRAIAANLWGAITTDKSVYTEVDQAVVTATARNAGSFAIDASARFTVFDFAGQVVDVLPMSATVSVPVAGTVSVSGLWPVAGILSGDYRVRADWYSPAGLLYGSATASFSVTASQLQTTSARINVDRVSYSTAQIVQVSSRVANSTGNTVLDNLQAKTEVRGAAGASVFSRTEPIEQLAPGGSRQYGYSLGAGTLGAGTYSATLQLLAATGGVLAQSTSSFTVLGVEQTGVGLTGQLQANPGVVLLGQPTQLTLVATNNATGNLAIVPLTVRLIQPESGNVVATFSAMVADWPAGQSKTLLNSWTAVGPDGQILVAAATAQVNGKDIALGQATIRLVGVPKLQAQPLQLTFTPIYVGENAGNTVTVSSIGTLAAGLLTFSLAGPDASQFAIPQGGCTQSASLPIGATCTLTISWRPQAAGSQAAEVQIGYDRGEPLRVSVVGQAKPVFFTGTVATDAPEVEAGQTVGLSYTVSNPATVTSQMAGTLSVRSAAGQTLSSWPLQLDVGGVATYAGGQPYTTSAEAQSLTVVLSQTVGTSTLVLATTSFTVVDRSVPVGVDTGIKGQARILVLLSCPPGLGTAEDAACVAQRGQAITNYLSALGYTAKVVATREAFVSEMRCGTYNTYWISGGAIKLDEQTVGELREAVYRGEALWMDGVHDSRNQLLHAAAGVKEIGKLPDANLTAALAETGVYGNQAFATRGQVTRFELTTGSAEGLFTQVPGQQAPIPAVVSNNYGRGKSLLYAFDLGSMVTADALQADAQLRGFITTSATYTASGSPTLTLGDVTQLSASINNLGTRTVALRAEATLPVGMVSLATSPQAQLTANTDGSTHAVWAFTLPGGAAQDLTWLVRVAQTGSFTEPLAIYSLPSAGGTLPPKLRATTSFTLQVRAAATLLQDALTAVNAVEPTTSSDKSNKTKAVNAVAQATALHSQGSYQQAVVQWLAAADALIGIASVDTAAARSALALAIEASTDALCIQRCGTAACQ
ncbi:MAG: repeat protein [Ramlibacter sp.]|jgi:hypothetical protein|nr:repeat protein [Ramlibacter sp.]